MLLDRDRKIQDREGKEETQQGAREKGNYLASAPSMKKPTYLNEKKNVRQVPSRGYS